MNSEQMQSMMPEMMEKMFGGMSADDKKEMMMGMMGKMCEGLDMKEMMPMMMGKMMQGGSEMQMPEMMPMMMGNMKQGGAEGSMPEMMLKMMMPHCIGMMLPSIDPDKRIDAATTILSAVIDKGVQDVPDDQKQAFLEALEKIITAAKKSTLDEPAG